MANLQNLKPFPKGSINNEEARKRGRAGGIKSGETRRRRKSLREELEILLQMSDKDGISYQEKITKALIEKACVGDTKAFEVVRDTCGETITNKVQIEEVPIISDDIK